jgi:hypothetical protein
MHIRNFEGSYSIKKKNWLTIMHCDRLYCNTFPASIFGSHTTPGVTGHHFMNQALPLVPLRGLKLDRRTMLQLPVPGGKDRPTR